MASTVASFLPSLFPGGGVSSAIPEWDASLEQRSQYPYTYTSILNPTLEGHRHAYTHGVGRGAAQGTIGSIRFQAPCVSDSAVQSSNQPPETLAPKTLCGHLIREIDPLATMYSVEWMTEIEQEFRDKIRSFLSEEAIGAVLGKTRCRDCLYYFEKPMVKPSTSRMASLGSFLSFWWGTPIQFGEKVYAWKMTKAQKEAAGKPWLLSHLDNGTWNLKK